MDFLAGILELLPTRREGQSSGGTPNFWFWMWVFILVAAVSFKLLLWWLESTAR